MLWVPDIGLKFVIHRLPHYPLQAFNARHPDPGEQINSKMLFISMRYFTFTYIYIYVGEIITEVEEKAPISALLEVLAQMTPQDLTWYAPKQSFHLASQRDSASHKATDTSRKGSEPA